MSEQDRKVKIEANRQLILKDRKYRTSKEKEEVEKQLKGASPGTYFILPQDEEGNFRFVFVNNFGQILNIHLKPVEGGFASDDFQNEDGTDIVYPTLARFSLEMINRGLNYRLESKETSSVSATTTFSNISPLFNDPNFRDLTIEKVDDYLRKGMGLYVIRNLYNIYKTGEFDVHTLDPSNGKRIDMKIRPTDGGFILTDLLIVHSPTLKTFPEPAIYGLTPTKLDLSQSPKVYPTLFPIFNRIWGMKSMKSARGEKIIQTINKIKKIFPPSSTQEFERVSSLQERPASSITPIDERRFLIMAKYHPFELVTKTIDFNTLSDDELSKWFEDPEKALLKETKPLLENYYNLYKNLQEIRKRATYRADGKKAAEEELLRIRTEDYRIVFASDSPRYFELIYRLPPLDPVSRRLMFLPDSDIAKLNSDIDKFLNELRESERARKEKIEKSIIEELQHNSMSSFKDINAKEAIALLEQATAESVILIPATDPEGYQLFARIPPFPILNLKIDIKEAFEKGNASPWYRNPTATLRETIDQLLREQRIQHIIIKEIQSTSSFKDISESQANVLLNQATTESVILIPTTSPKGYKLFARIPPFPILSRQIDIKREFENINTSPWYRNPTATLKETIDKLLLEQRQQHKLLLEIQADDHYRAIDLKSAEEQLRNITRENYRIIPQALAYPDIPRSQISELSFVLVYRLPSLDPVIVTFELMPLRDLDKLIEEIRKVEKPKKYLKDIQTHPGFKPTLTRAQAEETLELSFIDQTLILTNPDGNYECYIRVPPVTAHRTIPKDTELKIFIDNFANEIRQNVQNRRRTMEEVQQQRSAEQVFEDRSESSMRQLTGTQLGLLQAVREKYGKRMRLMGGVEIVLEDFQSYLKTKYKEHFITFLESLEKRFKELEEYKKQLDALRKSGKESKEIQELEHKIRVLEAHKRDYEAVVRQCPELFEERMLPLHYFKRFDYDFICKIYYQNPYHTAWRYFLNPNQWINPDAVYAAPRYNSTHADIRPELRQDIALLWLAASDRMVTPIPGFTTEGMMDSFVDAIVGIARAHNWDTIDNVREGPEKERIHKEMILKWGHYVDDMELDNPSCPMGVNQRLMDSIVGNPISDRPETRRLDAGVIRDYFKEVLGNQFDKYLSEILKREEKIGSEKAIALEAQLKLLKSIREAFENKYVIMSETPIADSQQKFFEGFRLKPENIKEGIQHLKVRFGERAEWIEMRTDTERYISAAHYFDSLARSPDPWVLSAAGRLDEIMEEREKAILKELERLGHKVELKDEKKEKEGKQDEEAQADKRREMFLQHFERTKAKKGEGPSQKPEPPEP